MTHGVPVADDVAHRPAVVGDVGQVVHEQRCAHGGDDDQRDVDGQHETGMARPGRRQHGEADELNSGDADVAAAGVEAERPTLQTLRGRTRRCWTSTTRSCRHRRRRRRRRSAASRTTRPAAARWRPARRNEQQRGADDRPVAPTEAGDGERVRHAQRGPRPPSGTVVSRNFCDGSTARSPGRGTAPAPTTCSRCRSRCARRRSRTPGCGGRRRAPVLAQKAGSSGRQSSIQ